MTNQNVVALLCADPSRATVIVQQLQSDGRFDAIICESSDAFCRMVRNQKVDAVIIEHDLPGFLTGLEIVERMASDLLEPVVILLTSDVENLETKAASLRVDTLLLDVQNVGQGLAEILDEALLKAAQTRISIPHKARMLVRNADCVPPLSQVLVRVVGHLQDDATSMNDLAADLATDPQLAAELLKFVNSSSSGVRNRITRVVDAVRLLGIRQTVSIVMSATVVRSQKELLQPLPDSFQQWFLPRCALIAATASTFASQMPRVSADTAKVLGLLQELGILVMARSMGEDYLRIVARCRTGGPLELHSIEQGEYSFTHADITGAILKRWEMPASLIRMALKHHAAPAEWEGTEKERQLQQLMQIGEAVADLHDVPGPDRHQRLQHLLEALGRGRRENCRLWLGEAVAKAREFSAMFTIPPPDPQEWEVLITEISQRAAEPLETGMVKQQCLPPAGEHGLSSDEFPSDSQASQSDDSSAIVLVIEDEPGVVKVIRYMLMPLGVKVLHASCGEEAEELAPRAAAILCDVHLAGLCGIDVIRQLRSKGISAPVLMISGDRSKRTVIECIDAGIVDYIVKPITRNSLFSSLRKHTAISLASELPAYRLIRNYVESGAEKT